jgi:ATPase subunit of ABC transporter with duplicated ATPase domains
MPSLRFERVSFAYADAAPLLDELDLVLPAGWTAVVGENGAGKSTLLSLAAGLLAPARGRVRLDPDGARVLLCPQSVEEAGHAVAALAAADGRDAHRLRAALALDPAALARWETLSPGERRRWQIGAALRAEPDVLLLDEPTNHADADARALLAGALARFRGVGLLVSHDRALIDALAVRTLRLHRGEARLHEGGYARARAAWEAEARAAWDRRATAQREARAAAARLADARRARDAADAARSGARRDPRDHDGRTLGAKTRRAWAEDRLGADVRRHRAAAARATETIPEAPPPAGAPAALFPGWERAPRPVLVSLDAAVVRAGPAPILHDVHAALSREDRVRVEGPNGAGKTTLLGALLAASTLPPGRVLHLPQELPAAAGPALLAGVRALAPDVRGRLLALVAVLGSDPGRLLASAAPSPGEVRKLLLALGLARRAWLLVLDEPTNHLDLPTIERLEEALEAYPGAIVLVTHDDAFAARCTHTSWRVGGGRFAVGGGGSSRGAS